MHNYSLPQESLYLLVIYTFVLVVFLYSIQSFVLDNKPHDLLQAKYVDAL